MIDVLAKAYLTKGIIPQFKYRHCRALVDEIANVLERRSEFVQLYVPKVHTSNDPPKNVCPIGFLVMQANAKPDRILSEADIASKVDHVVEQAVDLKGMSRKAENAYFSFATQGDPIKTLAEIRNVIIEEIE